MNASKIVDRLIKDSTGKNPDESMRQSRDYKHAVFHVQNNPILNQSLTWLMHLYLEMDENLKRLDSPKSTEKV